MKENPLKGYYFTRVYSGDDPFLSVMDLNRDEAVAACEKLAPCRTADGKPDHEAYLDTRHEVESWLKESARAVGVDTEKQNPVYFALTKEPEVSRPGRKSISIPAEKIDLSRCSFTFDDSFVNFFSAGSQGKTKTGNISPHPLHGVVFNAQQIAEVFRACNVPGKYDGINSRYIEAQMWYRPSPQILNTAEPPKKTPVSPSAPGQK